MKKLTIGMLTLVALLRWSAPVMAHGPGMGGPPGHHMMGGSFGMLLPPFMLNKLNLTDDQKTQVQGIMEDYHKTAESLFQQLRTVQEGMADKFYSPGDLKTADLTSPEASRLQEQIKNAELDAAVKVRALLTADQLAQAAQMRTQMQAMHAQMQSLFAGQ
ncbi:MAG: Spy/CpxP family protein refolding chaperone [Deltaproteobacteria bacterium]|nr:Spy/CpxP family protein refolding chaperone [Deltaproteobacteria bacterium]